MMRILGTMIAGLLGLAFGSFLNVCVSRWPEGESVVRPRSHCRQCGRTLEWWENVPLVSWLALRGKCRKCGSRISLRYPLVELAVGALWAGVAWQAGGPSFEHLVAYGYPYAGFAMALFKLAFLWLLVALSVLDAEHLWLPDRLTIPGILLGLINVIVAFAFATRFFVMNHGALYASVVWIASVFACVGLILLIRWIYWLIRRREGLGLGDVKLMAMIAAWLGLPGALLSLFIGVVLGAVVALASLARSRQGWAMTKLPLGTFLCIGGIVSALWGQQILAVYLRWAGF